jgi:predicted HTH domain antitoxin
MCQVLINVPNEVLYDTHMNNAQATAFARKMVALGYYTHNNVSIGYCAKIAGMTEEEFITFLGQNRVSIFQFEDEAELARDYANA